ncbi:putative diguanylate cyclase YdaM [bacterium HR40]|nr:putative diguanylate cyclase YdaM [bacterium HR40]
MAACGSGIDEGAPERHLEPVRLPPLPSMLALWLKLVNSAARLGAALVVAGAAALVAGLLAWSLTRQTDERLAIAATAAVAAAVGSGMPALWLARAAGEWVRARAELYEQLHRWRHVELRLRRLADTDDLTGLLNRRAFFERGATFVALARRYGHSLALALCDIDRFKTVNDRYGHAAGDAALREVATALRSEARASELVARLGGDEFAVLMPLTDLEGARRYAERLRERLRRQADFGLTVSIGLAALRGDEVDLDRLLTTADRMLYAAKEAGRDQIFPPPARPSPAA